jgi:hypothetical protein
MTDYSLLFAVLFVSIFLLVLFIIIQRGWNKLARKYHYSAEFDGKKFGVISAMINGVNYRNCLLLKYDDRGIYIKPVFMFRLIHKPVFIPFDEIKSVRDIKLFFIKYKELYIGEPRVVKMQIQESIFRKLEHAAIPGGILNDRYTR